jgi:hypothetical protein
MKTLFWNLFQMMVQLVQQFSGGNFSRHLANSFPEFSNHLAIIEDGDVSRTEN